MKNVKKSAVIISALLLVCAILFTGCPNGAGGAKPPTGSAGSSTAGSGGTGSGEARAEVRREAAAAPAEQVPGEVRAADRREAAAARAEAPDPAGTPAARSLP